MNFFRQNVGSPHAGKFAAPNEHWVTIGAVDGEGGTPVQLDKDGTIVKGPRNLTGAPVSDIGRKGQAAEHRRAADLLGEQEGKPGQARGENKSENKVASIESVGNIGSEGGKAAKGGKEKMEGGKMDGTVKQQVWANQIKDKIKATIQRDLDDKGTDPRMVATLTKHREWLETTMDKINDPKFWIDLEMTTKPAGVVASPIKLDWQTLMKEIRQKDVQQKFGIAMPSKT